MMTQWIMVGAQSDRREIGDYCREIFEFFTILEGDSRENVLAQAADMEGKTYKTKRSYGEGVCYHWAGPFCVTLNDHSGEGFDLSDPANWFMESGLDDADKLVQQQPTFRDVVAREEARDRARLAAIDRQRQNIADVSERAQYDRLRAKFEGK